MSKKKCPKCNGRKVKTASVTKDSATGQHVYMGGFVQPLGCLAWALLTVVAAWVIYTLLGGPTTNPQTAARLQQSVQEGAPALLLLVAVIVFLVYRAIERRREAGSRLVTQTASLCQTCGYIWDPRTGEGLSGEATEPVAPSPSRKVEPKRS